MSIFSFLRESLRMVKTGDPFTWCNHQWLVEDGCRRTCTKCSHHQMLLENKYPDAGEPKYEWQ